jgi:flagellar motor switch protein FliN
MADESQIEDGDNSIQDVQVELTVVLGKSIMPIEHLLRMGRGAVIELETMVEDDVWILVNNRVIARGQVMISGERLAVAVTESVTPTDYTL